MLADWMPSSRLKERVRSVRAHGVALTLCAGILACSSFLPSLSSESTASVRTRAVMWFAEYDEVFTGYAVRSGPILGGGVLDVVNDHGDLRCVGRSEVRIVPPSVRPMDNCDGLMGVVSLFCSDGRPIELEYHIEESCRAGYGEGADHTGHVVHAVFGGSERHTDTMAREARSRLAGSPRLPGRRRDIRRRARRFAPPGLRRSRMCSRS